MWYYINILNSENESLGYLADHRGLFSYTGWCCKFLTNKIEAAMSYYTEKDARDVAKIYLSFFPELHYTLVEKGEK